MEGIDLGRIERAMLERNPRKGQNNRVKNRSSSASPSVHYSVLRKIGFNWTGERVMQRKPCLACPIECPFLIERNTL